MKKAFFLLCCALLVLSCKKNKTEPAPDLGYSYYPGRIHSYIVYDMDSIVYRQLPVQDTQRFKFQIKEVMDTLITDNQNRPTIKIIRYRKNYSATIPYSAMSWTVQDVWTANKTNTNIQVVEENIRYTKLAFPAKKNTQWNGTAFTTLGETDYNYSTFDSSMAINGNSFLKTATVVQSSNTNAIESEYFAEIYARDVGMIYKEETSYKYSQAGGIAHPGQIAEGMHYVMTINSYGTE